MALPAAQPRYLACSQLNDGKAEAVNVKAWVYTKADGEPLVLLELRRLLHSCGKIARKEYVNDVVAKGCNPEGEWQNCFGLFGLTADGSPTRPTNTKTNICPECKSQEFTGTSGRSAC